MKPGIGGQRTEVRGQIFECGIRKAEFVKKKKEKLDDGCNNQLKD